MARQRHSFLRSFAHPSIIASQQGRGAGSGRTCKLQVRPGTGPSPSNAPGGRERKKERKKEAGSRAEGGIAGRQSNGDEEDIPDSMAEDDDGDDDDAFGSQTSLQRRYLASPGRCSGYLAAAIIRQPERTEGEREEREGGRKTESKKTPGR